MVSRSVEGRWTRRPVFKSWLYCWPTVFTALTFGNGVTNSISLMGKLEGLRCLTVYGVWSGVKNIYHMLLIYLMLFPLASCPSIVPHLISQMPPAPSDPCPLILFPGSQRFSSLLPLLTHSLTHSPPTLTPTPAWQAPVQPADLILTKSFKHAGLSQAELGTPSPVLLYLLNILRVNDFKILFFLYILTSLQ